MFDFFTHIITTILVGYLAFTNTLVGYIEPFFKTEETVSPLVQTTEETPLEKIIETSNRLMGSVPNILLENKSYQRAAIIASGWSEEVFSFPPDKTLSENITDVLVNIYCQYKTDAYIRTTTGSGFFINPKGVILTNAHVAQFLLLENIENASGDVSCVIRSGNPARPMYEAKLLYISPLWVFENASLIKTESPRGTGERDYALLYISEGLNGIPLPARFPAINVNTDLLARGIAGTSVYTAGYPADALIRGGADAELSPVVAETTLNALYTFGSNYADIFSISESPVGEHGASGGPIITPETESAIGLIVTKGDERTEGSTSLRALTLSYIDRTMIEETGFTLKQNMQGDIALRGNIFKSAMGPFLGEILDTELRSE